MVDNVQVVVTIGGILLIVGTLWFFLGGGEVTAATTGAGGVQEVDVLVQGGYSPDRIEVAAGRLVRLNFRRQETNPCTEQLIMSDFNIVRNLPYGETTMVEFTPSEPGDYIFHCGMNMVRGHLIVKP